MKQTALPQAYTPETSGRKLLVLAVAHSLARFVMIVEKWRLQHKSSMELARLDKHTLQDIGISDANRFIVINELS